MMEDIVQLYNRTQSDTKTNFKNTLVSSLNVKEKLNASEYDDTWLVKMEETVKYLDNILRNPNRFIVNEEEVPYGYKIAQEDISILDSVRAS